MSGEDQFLVHNFEEYRALRDVTFWFKYVTCVDHDIFPRLRDYDYGDANLQWQLKSEHDIYQNKKQSPAFKVVALGKRQGLTVRGRANDQGHMAPQLNLSGLKYPSGASPNSLGLPSHVETEDDVLHIRELPSFDDALGQADCELLISFLTVPYLRMPLSLEFFATNSRLHALASKDVRRLLQSIVLEPSRCVASRHASRVPTHVPAKHDERVLLGTSYGLLLSECAHAPQLVPVFMLSLLRQVDEGTRLRHRAPHTQAPTSHPAPPPSAGGRAQHAHLPLEDDGDHLVRRPPRRPRRVGDRLPPPALARRAPLAHRALGARPPRVGAGARPARRPVQ